MHTHLPLGFWRLWAGLVCLASRGKSLSAIVQPACYSFSFLPFPLTCHGYACPKYMQHSENKSKSLVILANTCFQVKAHFLHSVNQVLSIFSSGFLLSNARQTDNMAVSFGSALHIANTIITEINKLNYADI